MLSPLERQAIESRFPHYPDRQALCVEALKVVRRHRGRVPEESLQDIAELLNMAPEALERIATLYSLSFPKDRRLADAQC